jgi:hypothetical protein
VKANIEVKDRREADAIRAGLEDQELRAMAVVLGIFRQLPDGKTQRRVLNFVLDKLNITLEDIIGTNP